MEISYEYIGMCYEEGLEVKYVAQAIMWFAKASKYPLKEKDKYPYNIYLYECANGYILLDFNFGASTEFLTIYVSSDLSLLKDIMNEQRM